MVAIMNDVDTWNYSKTSWSSGIESVNNSSDVIQELINQVTNFGMFICPQCGKSYRSKYSLKRHMIVECGKEPQFTCPHCHRKIRHKHDLVVHMKMYCPVLREKK